MPCMLLAIAARGGQRQQIAQLAKAKANSPAAVGNKKSRYTQA